MHDGKALSMGTSHFFMTALLEPLISNTAIKIMNAIRLADSWGMSTRIIGAMIMAHSDDSGLVLPPHVARLRS